MRIDPAGPAAAAELAPRASADGANARVLVPWLGVSAFVAGGVLSHVVLLSQNSLLYVWFGYSEVYVGVSNVIMSALAAWRFEALGIRLFAKEEWSPVKRGAANFGGFFLFCVAIIVWYLALEGVVSVSF